MGSDGTGGLAKLTQLSTTQGGFRAAGNQLTTTVTLTVTPAGRTLNEGDAAQTYTATVSIDEGTKWASKFNYLDPDRDLTVCTHHTRPPAGNACYNATTGAWAGKVTATLSGASSALPVTLSASEHTLSIPVNANTPTSNSFQFTVTPGDDNIPNSDERVTISVTGQGVPGVLDSTPGADQRGHHRER